MVFGAKVVVTGDGFVPGERSVIIMNHRTRMDWMFLWNCLLRYSYLRLEKICLKSSLKSIPGFGRSLNVLIGREDLLRNSFAQHCLCPSLNSISV